MLSCFCSGDSEIKTLFSKHRNYFIACFYHLATIIDFHRKNKFDIVMANNSVSVFFVFFKYKFSSGKTELFAAVSMRAMIVRSVDIMRWLSSSYKMTSTLII